MYLKKVDGVRQVTLPDGSILSQADLPAADTSRWVASRKLVVVQAVAYGLLSRAEALEKYSLSDEELSLWQSAVAAHGQAALKVTSLQKFRQA